MEKFNINRKLRNKIGLLFLISFISYIGLFAQSPGGVSSGLNQWLKADTGLKNLVYENVPAANRSSNGSFAGLGPNLSTLNSGSSWSVDNNATAGRYLQLDLGSVKTVQGVVTQGRADADQWVTDYLVEYSNDGVAFTSYGLLMNGNYDRNTLRVSMFNTPITARYVRIIPQNYVNHKSMRVDLISFGTDVTADNSQVSIWQDQSPISADAAMATTANRPTLKLNGQNFNPVLEYDGVNDNYEVAPGFANFTGGLSIFSAMSYSNNASWARIMDYGQGQANDNILFAKQNTTTNLAFDIVLGGTGYESATTGGVDVADVMKFYDVRLPNGVADATVTPSFNINAESFTQSANLRVPRNETRHSNFIGKSNWGADPLLKGRYPEQIIYNRNLTDAERQKVQSYLAIKYGLTMGGTLSNKNYLSSNGTIVWTTSSSNTYRYNPAGIGRDDGSALMQKQSQNVYADLKITMGLASIEATNATNANTFPADQSFLMWGDNGGDQSFSSSVSNGKPGTLTGGYYKMSRTWKVQETGTIGTVRVAAPMPSTAYLIVSNDATFATGNTWYPLTAITINGVQNYYADVNFTTGQFFTYANVGIAPGGVSEGTARGWKVDYYDGNYADDTKFGTNTSLTTPTGYSYTGYASGNEYIAYDGDYFGLEYIATLEVPQAGVYTFNMSGVDDKSWLWVNNQYMGYGNTSNMTVTLPAGDVPIRVKFIEYAGGQNMELTWSGPGITGTQQLDGRFVKTSAPLTSWFMADKNTLAVSGGLNYINKWINQAPAQKNVSNLILNNGAAWNIPSTLVNYNEGGQFDGNDIYVGRSGATNNLPPNGYMLRNGTSQQFLIESYYTNVGDVNWQTGVGHNCGASDITGFFKNSTTQIGYARPGLGDPLVTSNYVAFESKLIEGFLNLGVGNGASQNNIRGIRANGVPPYVTLNTERNYAVANINTMHLGGVCGSYTNGAYIPEFIYYPFVLNATELRKVNTYLGVKYGITLGDHYQATNGTNIWNIINNATYNNRIFGIGREFAVEGLNQKQSMSRMGGKADNTFLILSKSSTIVATNDANSGVLKDGDYMLIGDNNASLTTQTTEIPTSVNDGSCTFSRISREWKVQITGTPGTVTLQAGSSETAIFKFTNSMKGIKLMIDEDGDGNFLTGTIRTYDYTSFNTSTGIATFADVTLNNNEVFTFVWKQTAPGGVAGGLNLWLKADDPTISFTSGSNINIWKDGSPFARDVNTRGGTPVLQKNTLNYNPTVYFDGGTWMGFPTGQTSFQTSFTAGDVFTVLKTLVTNQQRGFPYDFGGTAKGTHYTWDNGAIYDGFGTNDRFGWVPTNGSIVDGKTGIASVTQFFGAINWNLYNTFSATNNWGVKAEGYPIATSATNTISFVASGESEIGADGGYYFYGNDPEIILYNRVLGATERRQVETYLAIKYSLKNGNTDYIASDGVTKPWVWSTTYNDIVFGIGRDDCSGLDQRQSKSWFYNEWSNVKVGLGTINENGNELNTTAFTSDKQYLMMARNAGTNFFTSKSNTNIPTNYASASCNARVWSALWKVKNTGNVGAVQLKVGSNKAGLRITNAMTNPQLVVDTDGDGDFSSGVVLYTPTKLVSGEATFDNVNLPDGAVWSMVWTEATPGGVSKPQSGTSINGEFYVNGLSYKLYNGHDSDLSDGITGTLLSTGYTDNTRYFDDIWLRKIWDNFSVELTGKILLQTGVNYKFRANSVDDRLHLKIDNTVLFANAVNGTTTSATFTVPSTGYYDITVRGSEGGGGEHFYLDYSINNGTSYIDIPDNLLFVRPVGPSGWFMSDTNYLQTNANAADLTGQIFPDESIYGNDMTFSAGFNSIYYSTNPSFVRNYNPIIWSTDDRIHNDNWLNGFAYGKKGRTLFTTVGTAVASGVQMLTSYGTNATNEMFGTYFFNATVNTFGYGNDVSFAGYLPTAQYLNTVVNNYKNFNITPTNNAQIFSNGKFLTQANKDWWTRPPAGGGQLYINERYGDEIGLTGTLSEVIYFPWDLSATEQQKVNSYLAIKWGITLDQTTAQNYLASDGTVVWNTSLNNTFNNDITGIGRDDCGGLYQKQSTSTDGPDIISLGIGNIEINNDSNINQFGNDKSYLIIGHNNATITNLTSSGLPTSLTGATWCYQRTQRVWLAQEANSSNSYSIHIGKSGLFTFSRTYYKPKLLVSNSPTDFSNATIYDPTSIVNGIAKYEKVDIENGQYFTFAIIQATPGGVSTNLNIWLTADDATTLSSVVDNTALTYWNDASVLGLNTTAVNGPIYRSGSSSVAANFNPVVSFNGTNQSLTLPTGFSNYTLGVSAFSVLNSNFGTIDIWGRMMHLSTGGNNNGITWNRNNNTTGLGYEVFNATGTGLSSVYGTNQLLTTNGFAIQSFDIGAGTAGQTGRTSKIFMNGLTLVNNTSGVTPTNISRTSNGVMGNAAGEFMNGYLPEFILYSRTLDDTDRRKIHSYLAIKYGKTLDISVTNYASSKNDNIYSYSTHWNRITGIGRDDCSALEQKQSKSAETGSLITISNGSNLYTDNETNINLFPIDNSWLIFGDNNKRLSWSGVDVPSGSGNIRLNRVWRVKETGTVNTVFIQVPDNTSTLTTKLPTSPNPIYLIVANSSTSGKFGSTSGVIEVPMTLNGTNWEVTYDFQDGDYFTFSSDKFCLAPAGITDGLTSWFKTNELTNGVIPATTGTLTDQYVGEYNLTRDNIGTTTVVAGNASTNYNKSITFTGNAVFQKLNLTQDQVFSTTEGSMFSVVKSFPFNDATNGGIFGLNQGGGATIRTGISGKPNFNGSESSFANAGNTNTPNILAMTAKVGTGLQGIINGAFGGLNTTLTARPVRSDYNLSLNVVWFGGWNNGTFNEAISYDRKLENFEVQIINSYLAMKYGQTLSHNYFSPIYDGTNASTATLYDVSTYNNRVFGIGRYDVSCFSQNQSNSTLSGGMLKVSADGVFNAENSNDKTKFTEDNSYLILGDDNTEITWIEGGTSGNKNKPYVYSANCWDRRINRQWKVTNTGNTPAALIAIPDNSSSETTKLQAIPSGPVSNPYIMVMLINDNPDFAIDGNQREVQMTLNPTTKNWECSWLFDPNKTVYITFAYRVTTCGVKCATVNPMLMPKISK